MADEIKMRATVQGDIAEVKILMVHPMETGLRKDPKSGGLVPAHFIDQVNVTLNGKPVMEAKWGVAVSKNPFLSFKIKGAKAGDQIAVSASDNLGGKFTSETAIAAAR